MKKEFSTAWKASKQPRKQRKYRANAPIHIKRKMLSANLSKELRKKYSTRNTVVKKGDKVKIMRGKFKKKEGKIMDVYIKSGKITIEGIIKKKLDGSSVNAPMKASNLQIITLNLEKKRKIGQKEEKSERKTETKEVKKPESKETKQDVEKK